MDDLIQIRDKIYEIRGYKVMLDRDLAALYGVETRVLNQAVRRNIERFPDDFMFQLTKEECSRSQFVILNTQRGKNLKYLPLAFTEHGVAMLSSVLKSKTAIQINIGIMRAFVAVRQAIAGPSPIEQRMSLIENNFAELKCDLEEIFSDYNDINEDTRLQLELINESLAELQADKKPKNMARRRIGFISNESD